MSSMNYLTAIRDTILMAVHQQNFKSGAFKSQIPNNPPYLPVLKSFDVMIKSGLVTATEKSVLVNAKNAFFKLNLKFPEGCGKEPDLMDVIGCLVPMNQLIDIFRADAEARGVYIPPTMLQSINPDGTVRKTSIINKDGSTTVYQGGKPCVVPGAPEGFNEQQNGAAKIWEDLHKSKAQQAGVGSFNHATTSDDSSSSESIYPTTGPDTKKKSTGGKKDDLNFGKDFSENLKGAFM